MPSPPQLPLRYKLVFGSGSIAEGVKNAAFSTFLLFYYNSVLGLSGTLAGTAIFLALCVDAITDPLVGSYSDNFRSRWGRRHPFMYLSALPMAVCFLFLFSPPAELGQTGLFAWFTVFAVGVRVSMTFYQIPSGSMTPELTTDYDERTSIVGYRYLFGWLGAMASIQIGYLVYFAPSDAFADGRFDPAAYPAYAAMCAIMIFTAILLCSVGTHPLIPRLQRPPDNGPFTLRRFIDDIKPALRNRSYVMLVGGLMFASVAGGFNDVVGLYMNTFFWELTTEKLSLLALSSAGAAILGVALARPISVRFDKRTAAVGLATFGILFGPVPIFARLLGWMPDNDSALLLPLLMGHSVLLVTAVVAIGILLSSMVADVVDQNELATGRRQEGVFSSAIAFTAKATTGLGGFFAGVALDLIAFPRGVANEVVEPGKVEALGLIVGPGMMLLFLCSLIFLARFDITREAHRETLAELARRRERSPSE